MTETVKLPTRFAPAERATDDEIIKQAEYFRSLPPVNQIVNAIPNILLVLNQNRQIIFYNEAALSALLAEKKDSITGMRPGEILDCVHSYETEGGCGTTEFCRTCGAVKAILKSQKGVSDVQECRIIKKASGDALDLRVWASPFNYGNDSFTFFTLSDISDEKRRRALERIFFHDVLNTAGGIQGFAQVFKLSTPEEIEEMKDIMLELSERLVEEIIAQKDLTAAESGELELRVSEIQVIPLMAMMINLYKNHKCAQGKTIRIHSASSDAFISTDAVLLRRVVGNLIKNALEASQSDSVVELCSRVSENSVSIHVHNSGVIPSDVQLQIFQRSFSTKSKDRGLGTYSVKLLTEKYLKGKAGFTSTVEDGTVFSVHLPILVEDKTGLHRVNGEEAIRE